MTLPWNLTLWDQIATIVLANSFLSELLINIIMDGLLYFVLSLTKEEPITFEFFFEYIEYLLNTVSLRYVND